MRERFMGGGKKVLVFYYRKSERERWSRKIIMSLGL
jgi:hypothetical protein